MSRLSGYAEFGRQRIRECLAAMGELQSQLRSIAEVAEVLVATYRRGGKALFFGNGGSAADAQHLAAEFIGRFAADRRPLPALALSVNPSSLTALANDYGFEEVFARQIRALASPGDVAVALSTSGRSPNVLRGVEAAREQGIVTVGLTGEGGGALKERVDYCICVPSSVTPRIQECHILIGHVLCEIVERELLGGAADPR